MYSRVSLLIIISVLVSTFSCKKVETNNTPNPPPSNGEELVINGTKIKSGNNLYGLIKDKSTNKGIVGVPVSDGYSVTATDENGVYQFRGNSKTRYVFYTTPSEYKVNLAPTTKTPLFYTTKKIIPNQASRNDFVLEPLDAPEDKITLLMVADPQARSEASIVEFKSTTMVDIKETIDADRERFGSVYSFVLGDIVNSTNLYNLWTPISNALSRVALNDGTYIPFFKVIGNHDMDNNASVTSEYDADQPFIDNYGPTDYSLNRGNIHIVVMDNMVFKSTAPSASVCNYDMYFTNERIAWLKSNIALVPEKNKKTLVLCVHSPFVNSKHSSVQQILEIVRVFKDVHIMCGHSHNLQNKFSTITSAGGRQIFEHTHATASGVRYNGKINRCGAPIGYGIYEFNKDGLYNWVAKSTGFDESFQMKIYNGGDIYPVKYQTSKVFKWSDYGYGEGWFIVNVWNEEPNNWKVEFLKNGVPTVMRRVQPGTDVNAASFLTNMKNLKDDSFTKASRLYVIKVPSGNPITETNWTIRATHTIPNSGKINVYESNTFQRDYKGME